jgi:hypothetical protein
MLGLAVKFKIAPKIVVASLERNRPHTSMLDAMGELKSWVDFKGVETPRAIGSEKRGFHMHTHTDSAW